MVWWEAGMREETGDRKESLYKDSCVNQENLNSLDI